RRDKFLRRVASLSEDQRHSPEPPAEGLVNIVGNVRDEERMPRTVSGWGLPEFSQDNRPTVDRLLPLPSNRDLSPAERWTVLLAVHDACRFGRERLGPADSPAFLVSIKRADEMAEGQLPDLRVILEAVTLATSTPPAPVNATSTPADSVA